MDVEPPNSTVKATTTTTPPPPPPPPLSTPNSTAPSQIPTPLVRNLVCRNTFSYLLHMNSKSTRKNIFSSFFYNQILLHQIPKIEPETEPKTEPLPDPLPLPIPKQEPGSPPPTIKTEPLPDPLPLPPPPATNGTSEPPKPSPITIAAPIYINL